MNKMNKKYLSLLLLFSLLFTSFSLVDNKLEAQTASTGTTYYVSSNNGDDNNDGKSEIQAFKTLDKINEITLGPGDSVLLETDSVFNEQFLHVKGSGSEVAPIIISKYGTGADPIINTKGKGIWYQDYGYPADNPNARTEGYVSSAILLFDVEYIEISNLEITNDPLDPNEIFNKPEKMNRTGVGAVAQNKGTLDHIYLKDLYIHDINGNVHDKQMVNGGISMVAMLAKDINATGIARYNDILIENCTVENARRTGIGVAYTAHHKDIPYAEIPDDLIEKYGSTNIVIRNNFIKDVGGDAIIIHYSLRPIIESNVSVGAAKDINPPIYEQYFNNFQEASAGIWPWMCKDAIFQYNEVYDTKINVDAQAYDADWGDGTIYQYNYSHNNAGGAIMICSVHAYNSIYRYNISQNDLAGPVNLLGNPDAHFYNNVFYLKENVPFIRRGAGMETGSGLFENNIIYNSGPTRSEQWSHNPSQVYNNNLYYNFSNIPSSDTNALTDDPLFVNPGSAPSAARDTGQVHDRSSFDGYKVQENSPVINAAVLIENNGGQDFFGNKLDDTPDIGVYDTSSLNVNENNRIPAEEIIVTATDELPYNVWGIEGPVSYVNDNNLDSYWHTNYDNPNASLPESVMFEFSNLEEIDKIKYTPRAKGQSGNLNEYKVYVSEDGENWDEISSGALEDTGEAMLIEFKPVQTKHLRLEYLSTYGTGADFNKFATAVELAVYKTTVDTSVLESKISEIEKLYPENYSETSYVALMEKVSEVKQALESELTSQAVETYLTELENMIDALDYLAKAEQRIANSDIKLSATSSLPYTVWDFEGLLEYAMDGKTNTYWHTNYDRPDLLPQSIMFELSEPKAIEFIEYTPRLNSINGNMKDYKIYTSDDGQSWAELTSGQLPNSGIPMLLNINAPISKHIRIEYLSSYASPGEENMWATAAEFALFEKLDPLATERAATKAALNAIEGLVPELLEKLLVETDQATTVDELESILAEANAATTPSESSSEPSESTTRVEMVYLSFDLNGGILNGSTNPIVVEVEKGSEFTIIPAPTHPDGHKFLYWEGSIYYPGDSFIAEEDHLFTAKWEILSASESTTDGSNEEMIETTSEMKTEVQTPSEAESIETKSSEVENNDDSITKTGSSIVLTLIALLSIALAVSAIIILRKKLSEEN